jgi:putative transposase
MASQNRRRSATPATDGLPGEESSSRPARSERRLFPTAIASTSFKVLQRPVESAQYTSLAFGRRCELMDVRPSMGSVGDAYDNAMAESFFGTLECELLDRRTFRTPVEARTALFRYIEGWYNPRRRHSSLGYLSPANFERKIRAGDGVEHPGPAGLPAAPTSFSAGLGSTPLRAAEASDTHGRKGEETRLSQPQYLPVH